MRPIKDVKKKVLPGPEAEKILVSRSRPLPVSAPRCRSRGFALACLPFLWGSSVRLDRKTTVIPQLALGTETVGCLQQRYQQSGTKSDRSRGSGAAMSQSLMPAALLKQIAARLMAHRLEQIQLLIQPFPPPVNSRLRDLGQPLRAMSRGIDGGTATGNRPVGQLRR
jgi:hypothetical protein